jgi:hypothetical protein
MVDDLQRSVLVSEEAIILKDNGCHPVSLFVLLNVSDDPLCRLGTKSSLIHKLVVAEPAPPGTSSTGEDGSDLFPLELGPHVGIAMLARTKVPRNVHVVPGGTEGVQILDERPRPGKNNLAVTLESYASHLCQRFSIHPLLT